MSKTLGELKEHWLNEYFDTGFMEFDMPTVHGLAREAGDRVEVLAIYSKVQGQGHFRDFIAGCKAEYRDVRLLTIFEPVVKHALKRYGFRKFRTTAKDGEVITGMRWTAANAK